MRQVIPDRPLWAVIEAFRRERVDGTRTPSVIIAASLAALPLAILLASNFAEIARPGPVLTIAAIAAAVAGGVALLLGRWLAPHVAGIFAGVAGYAFFSMSWAKDESTLILLATWLTISLVATLIFLWLASDSKVVLRIAAGVCAIATIGLLSFGLYGETTQSESSEPSAALAFTEDLEQTPNVYMFVLDGFSNLESIETGMAEFDVDFGPEVSRLEAEGFTMELDARANYAETRLSVPSFLNAEYPLVPSDEPDWAARIDGEPAMRGDNATVDFFKAAGYEYWHSGSGIWGEALCDAVIADRCIGGEAIDFETFSSIWANSPLQNVLGPESADRQRPDLVVSLVNAAQAAKPSDKPVFLFSHMLLPHHPYRFDRNCDPIESTSTISSGSFFGLRSEYAGQALCTARLLADAMEALVAADPTAVVIVQADHGSPFTLTDRVDWRDETFRERIDIFRATRLPDSCRYDDPAAQSLINTLPVLHACLTNTEPDFIEPKILVTNYGEGVLYEGEHPDDRSTNSPDGS